MVSTLIRLGYVDTCSFCQRMTLKLRYDFEFFEVSTQMKFVRNCKICETCNTVHYFDNPWDEKITTNGDFLVRFYPTEGGSYTWTRITAKDILSAFYSHNTDAPLWKMLEPKVYTNNIYKNLNHGDLRDSKLRSVHPITGQQASSIILTEKLKNKTEEEKKKSILIKSPDNLQTIIITGNIAKITL